ncbi:MAG: hypothetical protein LC108_14170 [Anaerolineales bacterium]|nr:hypothetical protein [Anaerolineales bacterium]
MNPSVFFAQLTPERKARLFYALICGVVIGTICVWLGSFINVWLYPELPLFIDWKQILWMWLAWVLAAASSAGVAAYAEDGWGGIVLSAFLMTAIILIANFSQGSSNFLLNVILFFGLAIPFMAVMAPIAFGFSWLARRFLEAQNLQGGKRWQIIGLNIFVILALGILPGLYPKFNRQTSESLRLIHAMLQSAETSANLPAPLQAAKDFAEHRTQTYTLSQASSPSSTVGVDVAVHYADGYLLSCTVVLYPGSDPYLKPCEASAP